MPDNKKHHFVPRFYLKRFSGDGKSINLYNLPSAKTVLAANLRNQCYRDYFYGKEPSIEHGLSNVEGEVSSLLREVDKRRAIPSKGTPGFLLLTLYIAMQSSRTAHSAAVLDDMHDRMMKHLMGPEAEARGWDLRKVRIGIKDPAVFALQVAVEAYPLLLDLECKLLVARRGEQFITCDNPVVMYNQFFEFRKLGSNTGMTTKGLQIFFPLGPDKLTLFYDSAVYRVGDRKQSVIEVSDVRDMAELNVLQMCSASQNVYFEDSQLNLTALYRKARPFLRTRMSKFTVYPGEDSAKGRSEYLATSHEDTRTELFLSFVHVRKDAKRWREGFKKPGPRPAVVVRNPQIVKAHEDFTERVQKGEYKPGDFFRFLAEKGARFR